MTRTLYNPRRSTLTARGMARNTDTDFYLITLRSTLRMPSEVFAVMSSFNCAGNPDYDITTSKKSSEVPEDSSFPYS